MYILYEGFAQVCFPMFCIEVIILKTFEYSHSALLFFTAFLLLLLFLRSNAHTYLHVAQGKHRLPAMTVSVVLDKTPQDCHAYNFWFKSVNSSVPFFLFPSLCGRPSTVVSQALSISNSLHLSAAAEPEPHPHACQSQLHTFNPSYPSLCKAALLAPPLSILLSK